MGVGVKPGRGRSAVLAATGMVATAHPLATQIGVEILRQGGNAVDAALAVAAALGVVQPMMCGLGGDAFLLVYEASTGKVSAINGSGAAPLAATASYYRNAGMNELPLTGWHSVTVPGAVAAYAAAHRLFGTRPLEELWEPAAHYAEHGFALGTWTARWFKECETLIRQSPGLAAIFLQDGRLPGYGDIVRQPELAQSLRLLAQGGEELFYRGEIAAAAVEACRKAGGLFTAQDFAAQQAEIGAPLSIDYRGYSLYQTPPVSQGHIFLEEMALLEGFDLGSLGAGSAEAIHLMVEAKRIAFSDRLHLAGDPNFVRFRAEALLDPAYVAQRRAQIRPDRLIPPETLTSAPSLAGDTTYFAVVDGQGNAVSFILSTAFMFGAAEVIPGTGIIINDRAGRGFVLDEGHPNQLAPGKRTIHTLNCFIALRDGRPYLVGGTPGGDGQPQWNMQMATSVLDFGLNAQEAVEAPRWLSHPGTDTKDLGDPLELRIEETAGPEVIERLRSIGHHVTLLPALEGGGGGQLIRIDPETGVREGGSDPRVDGVAMGY